MVNFINNISDDILYYIFQYIPLKKLLEIKLVCHKWNSVVDQMCRCRKSFVVSEELFRGNYSKYPNQEKINDFIKYYLKYYGEFIEQVYFLKPNKNAPTARNVRDFVARHELNEDLLKGIIKYCSKLRIFDLRKHIFDEFSTFELIKMLPQTLEVLKIELCRLDGEGNVDEVFDYLFTRGLNLVEFSVYGSSYGYFELSDLALINLSTVNLQKIDLSAGFSLSITNLNWLNGAVNVTELHLERAEICDNDLQILTSTCRRLQVLTLAYSKNVTNFALLSQLTHLIELTLNGNRDNFDDHSLTEICRGCPNLKSLSLENCRLLTKSSVLCISNLNKLHHLDLCSVPAVDDACLDWICKCCQSLQTLLIKFCKAVTQNGLNFIICNLKNVKTVGCPFTGEELNRSQLIMNNSVVPYRLFPY